MKKTVLVTGASSEIGGSIALEFAKNGYNVVINYNNNRKNAVDLENKIKKLYGVNTLLIKADITKENEVLNMVNETIKNFFTIDVLINNAAYNRDNSYLDKTKKEFLRVLEVNVVGTFLVTKHSLKHMNNGTIINISSTDAIDTYNDLSIDYCASKAGVNSLTQTFSMANPNNKFISIMLPWIDTYSTKEMYQEYLKEELRRTNQPRLLDPCEVGMAVFKLTRDEEIKSGTIKILKISEGDKLCIKNLVYQKK